MSFWTEYVCKILLSALLSIKLLMGVGNKVLCSRKTAKVPEWKCQPRLRDFVVGLYTTGALGMKGENWARDSIQNSNQMMQGTSTQGDENGNFLALALFFSASQEAASLLQPGDMLLWPAQCHPWKGWSGGAEVQWFVNSLGKTFVFYAVDTFHPHQKSFGIVHALKDDAQSRPARPQEKIQAYQHPRLHSQNMTGNPGLF